MTCPWCIYSEDGTTIIWCSECYAKIKEDKKE